MNEYLSLKWSIIYHRAKSRLYPNSFVKIRKRFIYLQFRLLDDVLGSRKDRSQSIKLHSNKSTHTSKLFTRRSTLIDFPSQAINENELEEKLILNAPDESKSRENRFTTVNHNSDDSIHLIKENIRSLPIECQNLITRKIVDSHLNKQFQYGTTRIKLSLPISSPSSTNNHSSSIAKTTVIPKLGPCSTSIDTLTTTAISATAAGTTRSTAGRTLSGEFTLPTNPPITVTTEPQSSSLDLTEKENCFHDDQIYSPEVINFKEKRSSLDPSLKGTSTVVNYLMDLLKPSDNKLAMKLFGSRKGVLKERLRQQRAGHCIIHPCSNFRFVVNFLFFIDWHFFRYLSRFITKILLGFNHVNSVDHQCYCATSGNSLFQWWN